MRKTREDTEISKLRILLAAEEEFCQRGFVAANMDSIAKAAGMTKGAIFWHYGSKAGLFKAIIRRATERLRAIFKEAFSSSSPIMEKCRKVIKRIKKDKAFEVLMVMAGTEEAAGVPKEVLRECYSEIADIYEDTARRFSEAKERGELRADTDIRNVLVTITLVMTGFAKITEFKNLIAPIGGHVDDESVINAIFDGLLSFQKVR